MAIGRPHHVVFDCVDPHRVAQFWSAVFDRPITYADDDFVVVAEDDRTSGLAFQRAADHPNPTWPDPSVPQQAHLDVMVEDPVSAGDRVVALGATRLVAPDGRTDVYADPGGHPFCLIRRPGWAAPLDGTAGPAGTVGAVGAVGAPA